MAAYRAAAGSPADTCPSGGGGTTAVGGGSCALAFSADGPFALASAAGSTGAMTLGAAAGAEQEEEEEAPDVVPMPGTRP